LKTIKKGELEYLVFESFEKEGIRHCFSTRYGGVSEGVHSSMNLGFRQDKRENVVKNYDIICSAIGVDSHNTYWTRQVHEDNILIATGEDRGKGLYRERIADGYDALITNELDIVLTGFSADCVLIYYYDRVKKVIGIAHSGWRGTVMGIGAKVVAKMQEVYLCNTEDIICGIAPSIGGCCFQVDEPVVTAFKEAYDWADNVISEDKQNSDRWYIDLHSANEEILVRAGISRENIENSRICTRCAPERFFSHRAMGNDRGSMAGLISL
jgi:hypothetical protein